MTGSPSAEQAPDPAAARYHEALQPLARAACGGPIRCCSVAVADPGGRHLTGVASWGPGRPDLELGTSCGPLVLACRNDTPWGRVVLSGLAEVVGLAELIEALPKEGRALGARLQEGDPDSRVWLVPVRSRHDVVGVCALGVRVGDAEVTEALAEQIARPISTAIRRVDLAARLEEGPRLPPTDADRELTAELLRSTWEMSPAGLALVAPDGEILEVNGVLARALGCRPDDLVGRRTTDLGHGGAAMLTSIFQSVTAERGAVVEVEHPLTHAERRLDEVATTARWVQDRSGRRRAVLVAVTDLSAHRRLARLRESHRRVFAALQEEKPLTAVLERLVRAAEAQMPGSIASVVRVDATGERLASAVAPSLDPSYLAALRHGGLDPRASPDATAAAHERMVIAEDATHDERWPAHQRVAAECGVRGIWSMPCFGAGGEVVAVMSVRFPEARAAAPGDLVPLEDAARLAGLAFEHDRERGEVLRRDEEIRRLARREAIVREWVDDGVIVLDAEGRCTEVNAAAEFMLGWKADELAGRDLHATVHHSLPDGSPNPPRLSPILRCLRACIALEIHGDTFWTRDGRPLLVDHRCSPIDPTGAPEGAVLVMRPASFGRHPASDPVLTRRERDILQLLASGMHGPEITQALSISQSTFQSHLKNAITKLGASGRTHAVVVAAARGEIELA